MSIGLSYCDSRGRIYFDPAVLPLADGGSIRTAELDELIPAPPGTVSMVLPKRFPRTTSGIQRRRSTHAVILPAGYTRLLLPAYETAPGAPVLPLFGYTFACEYNDELYVAAMRTDESDDWTPRNFCEGELEAILDQRLASDPGNRVLQQVALCSREYGCFTAQNVFFERGEAALPVSPKCNARCIGCISEQDDAATIPSPQARITDEVAADELARIAIYHLERVEDGIVSFGQGCEGEPLLRSITIARAIEKIRAASTNGTINLNTNGSQPKSLRRCIDAGLQAVRISLNSFRPHVYGAYYRPIGYTLDDVLESVRLASSFGLRVSLNLLTHPGVTDAADEVKAMCEVLRELHPDMIQTRTLNIDPEIYFAAVGRPERVVGMRVALAAMHDSHVRVGNFTHTH